MLIADTAHPLAAGLAPGAQAFTTVPIQVHWGSPDLESGTVLIGTNPANESHALIFGVETGTVTSDFTHPARRVHFGIFGNTGAATLTEAGVQLFDAAINWLLPDLPQPAPQLNPPTVTGNQVVISWTGAGTLEDAPTVTGPWTNSPNQANPQNVPATGTKFFRVRQ